MEPLNVFWSLIDLPSWASSSGENARRRGGLVTGIGRACRLDQQDMHFAARHGPMFDALGHDKHLTGVEGDRAIAQLDIERPIEDEEKIVRVVVLMPVERTLKFPHHDVVVVVSRDRARGET